MAFKTIVYQATNLHLPRQARDRRNVTSRHVTYSKAETEGLFVRSLRFYFGVYFGGTDAEILMDQGQSLNAAQQFLVTAQETIFQV